MGDMQEANAIKYVTKIARERERESVLCKI